MCYDSLRLYPEMSETDEAKIRRESEATGSSSGERGAGETTPVKKKRHRRGRHRRRWKPYSKMTPEERQQAESREAARAAKRERDLVRNAAAPWNTTQYIMENHDCGEINIGPGSRTISTGSCSASDEYDSHEESGVESGVFWNKDYEMVVAEMEEEELRSLSHEELLKKCIQLREELKRVREDSQQLIYSNTNPSSATDGE